MSSIRRTKLSLKRGEAMTATRVSVGKAKLVYLLCADKKLIYPKGKSRIAYIGTTKKGVSRIAQSVATRADKLLRLPGVHSFHARIVTCRPRQRVKTWIKLERAMIILFREMYGSIPKCNSNGNRMKRTNEFNYFSHKGVRAVLEDLA